MKKIKQPFLIKIALILVIILLSIFIIKECKILGFCYTLITLVSPVFFGYALAWLIKPIMFYFNRHFNVIIASSLAYLLVFSIVSIIIYLTFPVVYTEIKDLTLFVIDFYGRIDSKIINNLDLSTIGTNGFAWLNHLAKNIKDTVLNIFYSLFISFIFLINHQEISKFLAKKIPPDLINNISINLKAYVKGTIIDTLILFILSLVAFYFIKLPYFLLFAILISLTNMIPYIGPYIGGIPACLVALGISRELGLMVLGIVILLQIIESSFIHPYIMSKALHINQILIMLSLIICGYFWGLIGMLISTPIISVIKTLYEYHKAYHLFKRPVPGKS